MELLALLLKLAGVLGPGGGRREASGLSDACLGRKYPVGSSTVPWYISVGGDVGIVVEGVSSDVPSILGVSHWRMHGQWHSTFHYGGYELSFTTVRCPSNLSSVDGASASVVTGKCGLVDAFGPGLGFISGGGATNEKRLSTATTKKGKRSSSTAAEQHRAHARRSGKGSRRRCCPHE